MERTNVITMYGYAVYVFKKKKKIFHPLFLLFPYDWSQCLFALLFVFFTPQGLLIAFHLPINYCEEPLYDLDDFNTVTKAVLNALVCKLLFLDCFNRQHLDGQRRNI